MSPALGESTILEIEVAQDRPKIDPRRLQDEFQELLFSTSFLTSILVRFCSHFGSHVGSLFGAKSTPYLDLVELKTTKIAVCVHVRMNFTLCTFVCISLFSLCARLCKIRTHMHAHREIPPPYLGLVELKSKKLDHLAFKMP